MSLADDFLAKRNREAAAKPSPLPGAIATPHAEAAERKREVLSREVFDADDFLEVRNAEARAKLNPLAPPGGGCLAMDKIERRLARLEVAILPVEVPEIKIVLVHQVVNADGSLGERLGQTFDIARQIYGPWVKIG